jgi:hypothetical protein
MTFFLHSMCIPLGISEQRNCKKAPILPPPKKTPIYIATDPTKAVVDPCDDGKPDERGENRFISQRETAARSWMMFPPFPGFVVR